MLGNVVKRWIGNIKVAPPRYNTGRPSKMDQLIVTLYINNLDIPQSQTADPSPLRGTHCMLLIWERCLYVVKIRLFLYNGGGNFSSLFFVISLGYGIFL